MFYGEKDENVYNNYFYWPINCVYETAEHSFLHVHVEFIIIYHFVCRRVIVRPVVAQLL